MAPRKKYYVGKSKIHGEGSFAKKDLSAGEYIGKAHTVKKLYSDYDFTELGMKHNHSENPSTLDVEIGNERHLIAKRPIKKGEELTTNYRVLQDLKQPEDFENGGWLDKYDAPQAQNGIEGTMGGLTDKGFNYNGAWGGPSMQMGGNIMPAMAGANQTVPMARDGRRQPIYTSDPKDPRLRNYKDSLSLYNQTKWLQDLKFDGSRTIGSGQPIYGRLATNRNVINNPDAEWNYYNNINRNIRPVAYLDEYYVNSPNDRQPTTLSGRVALYKKPVQPVTYKKSQPKPPRKLEKPGKVDLPEQIQFKDLPQPRGGYKSAAPVPQMISDKPTKYSFTYGDERNQKSIYFPNKTIWQAFVDQYDGLNTTERAGSFEATPVTYSTYRRPNPAFKDVKFAMGGSLPGSVGFTYARTAGAAPANGPYAKKTKASAQNGAKIPVIEDAGSFNKEGVWIPDWEKMTAQAKKLGAKKVRTKHGSVIYFNDKWEVSSVDDNPDAKAQNGQEMKYYQEGLDFKPKTISQDGSDIPVDPMGYWNPENVGNPVTIPSNIITMEGVDEPLIGISDTGDVQYMMPGEDYEFDGEYVTEYPVAQGGKRVPIIVSDPKDPRLKAYQDSLAVYNSSKFIKEHPLTGNYIPGKEDERQANINFDKKNVKKYNPKFATTYTGYYWDYKKPVQPVEYRKPEPKQEVVKKPEPVVEKKAPLTDYFQGTSVYAPTPYHGSGAGAFVGYRTPQGDTVFVKPEDYERMAVPKYGREFIESKKKMKNGGVSVNNADAQPLKKLDQLLNFTNYNKPTKGGWLDKYN